MPSTIWKPALTKGATGRHSSEHSSWYARNASKTFGKRKLPSTPRRSESPRAHSLCACLTLDCSRIRQRAPDRARASFPSSSNLPTHRRPLFGTSLVYVYDGGVIPHRWLISTIPTTAVTPHNNSDTPWGDREATGAFLGQRARGHDTVALPPSVLEITRAYEPADLAGATTVI